MIHNALQYGSGGGSTEPWNAPSDWININTVGDNEINLLVTSGAATAFTVAVTGSGTYDLDWGDGTIEVGLTGDGTTVRQHTHLVNGTPCSLGYDTWKVKIYNASAAITRWKVSRHTLSIREQNIPILQAVFGTTGLTSLANAFYDATGDAANCSKLQSCTLPTLASCTTTASTFQYCISLVDIKLPTSWGAVTDTQNMFNRCYSLANVTIPASWDPITNASFMFANCLNLSSIVLPASWGTTLAQASHLLAYCKSLVKVTLPAGPIGDVPFWKAGAMFIDCWNLKQVINMEYIGTTRFSSSFYGTFDNCEVLGTVILGGKVEKMSCCGTAAYINKITSVRLTGTTVYDGSGVHVDVSYCDLSAAALNTLFGDLPTIAGKTIMITGCTGAATCDQSIATAKGWTVTN